MENQEQTTNNYYNAKPSKIGNIGKDISGAKRMNFDTYETTEQREIKERKKTQDKQIAAIKSELKTEILNTVPSVSNIIDLHAKIFDLTFSFHPSCDNARAILMEKRSKAIDTQSRADFNKLVNSFNKFKTTVRKLQYHPSYYIKKMRSKYEPKGSFTEQSGQSFDWKSFDKVTDLKGELLYLSNNVSALQFGNSVSDNERAYISIKLAEFINQFKTHFPKISLQPVNWSFGARGKAGSVAYYQASGKIVSVNRNNIGSIIHELGHYIDDISNRISSEISYNTVHNYMDKIKEGLSSKSLNYYCKRTEIFARAFEAYCYKHMFNFDKFAQCGDTYLPELNDELINLIEKALA